MANSMVFILTVWCTTRSESGRSFVPTCNIFELLFDFSSTADRLPAMCEVWRFAVHRFSVSYLQCPPTWSNTVYTARVRDRERRRWPKRFSISHLWVDIVAPRVILTCI
ncbi:hypothetical protein OF83DRAFT_148956 [Amylostereum chailletii]|nr:hypothetical protein OF83DRAFT_148956 [Amylostereum chailletii]